jgi:prepilin-type N-terminal cleavage/methylation domain-containing protein
MFNKKAFTLIELLVVVAIVGILSGFIFVSMTNAINAAKDAKRKADLSSIEKALLVYGVNHGGTYPYSALDTYPCNLTGSINLCTNTNLSSALSPYLGVLPTDPNGTSYTYTGVADTSSFVLTGTLSNGNSYYYSSPNLTWTETSSPFVGWGYKKAITLSSTLTQDYQIKLTIPFGAGGCESHCNADFSDLRFASTSGTALSYWIESYTASTTATVWVKALNGSSSFNMYYGKTGVTTTANGNNTFEFFDDFIGTSLNGTKWTAIGSHPISNSIISITSPAVPGRVGIIGKASFGNGYSIRSKVNPKNGVGGVGYYFNVWSDTVDMPSATHVVAYYQDPGQANFFTKEGSTNSSDTYTRITAWAIFESRRINSISISGTVNDGTPINISSNIATGNLYPVFQINGNTPNGYTYDIDWTLIRKYQSSEPTPSIGTELTN